jgi:hypothetical protein
MTKEQRHERRNEGKNNVRNETYKKQIATIVIRENLTLNAAAKRFDVPNQTISRWVLRYYDEIEPTNTISSMNHPPDIVPAPLLEPAQYESQLRRSQLKISALETLIDVAEQTYNIAIRKNAGTKQHK